MNDTTAPGIRYIEIPLSHITPDPGQVRRAFDAEALQQLAESIRANGVIQPIGVRSTPDGSDGTRHICPYQIIAGERRWRASAIAGRQTIPAVVRDDLSPVEIETLQVLENLQRQDLQLGELASGVRKLVAAIGFERTCSQLGKSPAWVSKHASLGDLPPPVLDLIHDGILDSADTAKELGQLYELERAKAELYIGRWRGEVNRWGYPLRGGNDEPHEPDDDDGALDQATAEELRERRATSEMADRPTRAELRTQLTIAREAERRREEARIARAAGKSDPEAAARKAEEKRKKAAEADRERAYQQKYRQLQKDGDEYAAAKNIQIARLAYGQEVPASRLDRPFDVTRLYLGAHGRPRLPASAAGLRYEFAVEGSAREIAPALELICPGQHLTADISDVPLHVARQIEDLIGRELDWCYSAKLTGEEIDARLSAAAERQPQTAAELERRDGAKLKASDAYDAYRAWCEGVRHCQVLAPTSNVYGEAWAGAGVKKVRSNGIHYLDVALKEAP